MMRVNIRKLIDGKFRDPIALAAVLVHEGAHASDPDIKKIPKDSDERWAFHIVREDRATTAAIKFMNNRERKIRRSSPSGKFTRSQLHELAVLKDMKDEAVWYLDQVISGKL